MIATIPSTPQRHSGHYKKDHKGKSSDPKEPNV
jgi:hypothetical protein